MKNKTKTISNNSKSKKAAAKLRKLAKEINLKPSELEI